MADGVVDFDYNRWIIRFPEFKDTVGSELAQMYWDEAGMTCLNNSCNSIVRDDRPTGVRAMLLNLIVAHMAQLNIGTVAQPASPLVGPVASASQGSVSVSTVPSTSEQGRWFMQTKYGAAYWQASKTYRLGGHYHQAQQPYLGVLGRFGRRFDSTI